MFTYAAVCPTTQARSQFKNRSTANNVSIMVPVPSDADSPKFKTSMGSAKWVPEKNAVQWNIKSFPVRSAAIAPELSLNCICCILSFKSITLHATAGGEGTCIERQRGFKIGDLYGNEQQLY